MVQSLQKIFRDQKLFVVNRLLRLVYGVLITYIYFGDNFFQVFFVAEGVIQLLSVFLSLLIKRKKLFVLFFLFLIALSSLFEYFFIFGFVILESLYSLYQFNFKRKFNQTIEVIYTLCLFSPLIFFSEINFYEYSKFIFSFSLIKLIYIIKNSNFSMPEVVDRFHLTLFRNLTSINIRYFLIIFSVHPVSLIIFRILNQLILFTWSYLKSKTELPYARFVSENYFTSTISLCFFIFINSLLLLSYYGYIILWLNIIFVIYILSTIYFLLNEIILYRRKN